MLGRVTDARARARPPGEATGPGDLAAPAVSPAAGPVWWLAGVAAAFSTAQLAFVAGPLRLSWDEVVYISQVSLHAAFRCSWRQSR
jgi:hypothetical protein